MADKIKHAYESSKNIYDDVLTQGSFLSRLYIRVFWSGADDNAIAARMLGTIPDRFSGKILDVPCGTAVFTEETWKTLKGAEITCLDYSEDMLEQAGKRFAGCSHITCVQGDVGALPMADESFDLLVSMNGFHAFPDKDKAYRETFRVLKRGGEFLACFYIRGKSGITDWLVKHILAKKGWFTPPFQTEAELRSTLEAMYEIKELHVDGSIVWFRCVKPDE